LLICALLPETFSNCNKSSFLNSFLKIRLNSSISWLFCFINFSPIQKVSHSYLFWFIF
jgi:hypothetical protein